MIDGRRQALELRRTPPLNHPRHIASALGLTGRNEGADGIKVLCPWHGDRSPSCSITRGPDGTVRAKCFACHETGDALDLIGQVYGLPRFVDVLEVAVELTGGAVAPAAPEAAPEPPPRLAGLVLKRMLAAYVDGGLSKLAELYLGGRGILAEARADGWFSLPRDAGADLRRRAADDAEPFTAADLDATGLYPEQGGDRLSWDRHELVIPWRDPSGRIDTIQRGRIGDGRGPKYVFPRGRGPQWPHGCRRLTGEGELVIVEGAVDVLALRTLAPSLDVIGVPGVSVWRREWSWFVRGREVLIAFDDDQAGDRAADDLADRLRKMGAADVYRWTPCDGGDWGEALQALRRVA